LKKGLTEDWMTLSFTKIKLKQASEWGKAAGGEVLRKTDKS